MAQPRMFADLHVHPTLYNFNRMRNHEDEYTPSDFHPWTVPPGNIGDMAKGNRAASYSQADMPKLHKSKTRIVYASICPIEKGFFTGQVQDGKDANPFSVELIKLISGATLVESGLKVLQNDLGSAAKSATKILANRGPLRQFVQKMFMRYGIKRVQYLSSRDYSYWGEFWREYEFYKARDGVEETADCVWTDANGREHRESVTGQYQLIKSAEHFQDVIENTDDVALLHTIEGAYTFSIGRDAERVDERTIFERIDSLKTLDWPLLFLTLAHHFDNGLCGHAHSVPDAANLVMDQSERLNEGFERGSNDLGIRVVRELLDLDEQLHDQGGRRILIDCKHMSAESRLEYYEEVVKPYNRLWDAKSAADKKTSPKIPVFFSHVAYSGIETLERLIANADHENDHWHAPPFYAWNINASAEDVRMVHQTDGLLGLVFDQRVCGVGPRHKVADEMWPELVARQFFAMVDVIMLDDSLKKGDKKKIWDCVCLGTDYDGLIDPLSKYPTAMNLSDFAADLAEVLEAHKHTRYIAEIGVDELVEKICWKNGYDFAMKHLPAASR